MSPNGIIYYFWQILRSIMQYKIILLLWFGREIPKFDALVKLFAIIPLLLRVTKVSLAFFWRIGRWVQAWNLGDIVWWQGADCLHGCRRRLKDVFLIPAPPARRTHGSKREFWKKGISMGSNFFQALFAAAKWKNHLLGVRQADTVVNFSPPPRFPDFFEIIRRILFHHHQSAAFFYCSVDPLFDFQGVWNKIIYSKSFSFHWLHKH